MKVVVVGGGLMGVTTAYFLAHRGYEVTVIEQQAGPASLPFPGEPAGSNDVPGTLLA